MAIYLNVKQIQFFYWQPELIYILQKNTWKKHPKLLKNEDFFINPI